MQCVPIFGGWRNESARWNFYKGRDHHQGRAGSIPETLGRTGTFFDERAQRIIPERTGRYGVQEINGELKELRKKIRLSQQIEKQSLEMEERLRQAKEQEEVQEMSGKQRRRQNGIGKEVRAYELWR